MVDHKTGSRDASGTSRGMAGWLGQVVAWLIIVSVGAVLTVALLVPRLGGATPYTILTGSMRPGMPPGTLVVSKPIKTSDIGIGTVVTYQLRSGSSTVVTHRVVGLMQDRKGRPVFITQGDANNVPDAKPVLPVQIRGARWYSVPDLGYVNTFITGKERHITTIFVVSGLLLYAAYMFTSDLRSRLSRHRHRATA